MEITVKLKLDSPDKLTAEEIEKDIRMTEHEIGWSFDYKIESIEVTDESIIDILP